MKIDGNSDVFYGKFFFENDKIDGFSFEIFKGKEVIWPENVNFKGFFLKKNHYNSLITLAKDSKILIEKVWNYNDKTKILQESKERKKPISIYNSFYSKKVIGAGLHQKALINFTLEAEEKTFSKGILNGKCNLLLLDYLWDTNYIDIEEFPPELVRFFIFLV